MREEQDVLAPEKRGRRRYRHRPRLYFNVLVGSRASSRLAQTTQLVAVFAPVIIGHVPQAVGISAIVGEQDGVARRGGTPPSCEARGEGIHRFSTIVQDI